MTIFNALTFHWYKRFISEMNFIGRFTGIDHSKNMKKEKRKEKNHCNITETNCCQLDVIINSKTKIIFGIKLGF